MRHLLAIALATGVVAAVAPAAQPGGILGPISGLTGSRSCSVQASNASTETLTYLYGYDDLFTVPSSVAASELRFLPLSGVAKVNDTMAPAPGPGQATLGAPYVWVNPIDGACGGGIAWKGDSVEKDSTVSDTAKIDFADNIWGANTFSCTATGGLDCAAVTIANGHNLALIADITSIPVYICHLDVSNDVGQPLAPSDAGVSIPAGATVSGVDSWSRTGCDGAEDYGYPTGATSRVCVPDRSPIYSPTGPVENCTTVAVQAEVGIAWSNTSSGMSATCAPLSEPSPIACAVTIHSQTDRFLSFSVDVYLPRSTSSGGGRHLAPTRDGRIRGGARDEIATGSTAGDRFDGRGGNDILHPSAGDDVARGGPGHDVLAGGAGNDNLGGGGGGDVLVGGGGHDTLLGGPGSDLVYSGSGNDRIWIRDGERDVVHCGAGADYVVADRQDEWHRCESVDVTGGPLPQRRPVLLAARDLPGTRWHAGAESGRLRRFRERLAGGPCASPHIRTLHWGHARVFARSGPGLSYVAASAEHYRTVAVAKRAAAALRPARQLGCLARAKAAASTPLHLSVASAAVKGRRVANADGALDVLTVRRGRTVAVFAFFGTRPALGYEAAIVRRALARTGA